MTRNRSTKILLLGAAMLSMSACAVVDTQPDQAGLLYSSGPIESRTFDTCVGPSTKERGDWIGGDGYVYPAGQRTYNFNGDGGDNIERGDISVVTKDEATVNLRGLLTFTLNTECEVLQEFHERIGLKYGASAEGVTNWTGLLNDYLGTPLQDAAKREARAYTWRELYTDDAKKQEFIDKVVESLPGAIKGLAGGEYFTPGFTLQVPTVLPPQGLLDQIAEQQTQAERLATIDSQAAANAKEAENVQRMVDILGQDNYLLWQNLRDCGDGNSNTPCIPFLPVPAGGSVNVPAPTP